MGCWSSAGVTGCSDPRWLVPDPGPEAGPGTSCSVSFADGTSILEWSVSATPADTTDPPAGGVSLSSRDVGPPVVDVPFTCPAAGDRVIVASLRAQDGDQSYVCVSSPASGRA